MLRDKLFIVDVDFRDPAYPDEVFYCCHCAFIEGLLELLPEDVKQARCRKDSVASPALSGD